MNINPNVQAILHQFLPSFQQQHSLSLQQTKVCSQLMNCRTPAMGGQYVKCNTCEFTQRRYHSCRNRHCPQCQQGATQAWTDQQMQNLLAENYFHLVFTLPHELNDWVKQQPDVIYRLLFRSVWQTIMQLGADEKRLNGQMRMTAALHTWGQNLSQHVHLHCLIPGGALSVDGQHWHRAKSDYLFPVRALSRCFRGKMVSALRQAKQSRELYLPGQLTRLLDTLMTKEWVVYAKHTLTQAQSVVRYLARYTYKAAISNARIRQVDNSGVQFRWKDYRDEQQKVMTLRADEFIRRYLLHVLPKGFMRIRHFGFLANRCRAKKLKLIQQLLLHDVTSTALTIEDSSTDIARPSVRARRCRCPKCRRGQMSVCYNFSVSHQRRLTTE